VAEENGAARRRPKVLSAETKWEIFLQIASGEITQADAARKWTVDVSTVIGIRRTVKDAALAALAAKPGRPAKERDWALEAARQSRRLLVPLEGLAVGERRSHDNTAQRAGRATRARKVRRRVVTPPERTSTPCASSANVPPRPGRRPVRSPRWHTSSASGRSRTGVGREADIDEGRSRGDLGRDRTHP